MNCPECNKEISDTVKTCPNCGYKIKRQNRILSLLNNSIIFIFCIIHQFTTIINSAPFAEQGISRPS